MGTRFSNISGEMGEGGILNQIQYIIEYCMILLLMRVIKLVLANVGVDCGNVPVLYYANVTLTLLKRSSVIFLRNGCKLPNLERGQGSKFFLAKRWGTNFAQL